MIIYECIHEKVHNCYNIYRFRSPVMDLFILLLPVIYFQQILTSEFLNFFPKQ